MDNVANADFRTWLKLELQRHHLSQAELARMSGVPQPTIQRIISGETGDPPWSTIKKLREVLSDQPAPKNVASTNPKESRLLDLRRVTRSLNSSEGIVGTPVQATEFYQPPSSLDIRQIRRANMVQLLGKEKSKVAFARKVGTDPAYVSQILSDKTRAAIGDALARNIEMAYELNYGWMDNVHTQQPIQIAVAAPSPMPNEHAELLEAWAYLLPAEREAVMKQIRLMALHNKAVLEHYSES